MPSDPTPPGGPAGTSVGTALPGLGTAAPEAVRPTVVVSLLAGLCPLIPLPFVDDWAEGVVRRRAVRDLLREHGVTTTPGDLDVLAGLERPASGRGCLKTLLLGPLIQLAGYLVRKVLRKVVFVLAINDAVNAASSLFHDAWLLRLALDRQVPLTGPDGRIDREWARWLRRVMEATVRDSDPRPLERSVRRALAGSGKALREAARQLGRWARGERRDLKGREGAGGGEGREAVPSVGVSGTRAAGVADDRAASAEERAARDLPLADEERRLAGLVDKLVDAVWLERGYLAGLERRFLDLLAPAFESRPRPSTEGAGSRHADAAPNPRWSRPGESSDGPPNGLVRGR